MAGPNDFTGQNIQDTYQRVLQISSSGVITDGTGSIVQLTSSSIQTAVTASHALFAVSASHEITFELSSSHAQTADALTPGVDINVRHITASGNISASYIFAEQLNAPEGTNKELIIGGRDITHPLIDFDITIGNSDPSRAAPLTINSNITASNNISASGDITANFIFLDGNIVNKNDIDTGIVFNTDRVTLVAGNSQSLNITPHTVELGDKSTTHVTASGNISSSATIISNTGSFNYIETSGNINASSNLGSHFLGGDLTVGDDINFGIYTLSQHASGRFRLISGSTSILSAQGIHLTASGNISASGTIIANALDLEDGNVKYDASSNILKIADNINLGIGAGPAAPSADLVISSDGTNATLQGNVGNVTLATSAGDTIIKNNNAGGNIILQSDKAGSGQQGGVVLVSGSNAHVSLDVRGNITSSNNVKITGELELSDGNIRSDNNFDFLQLGGSAQQINVGKLGMSASYSGVNTALGNMATLNAAVFGGDVSIGPSNNGKLGIGMLKPTSSLDITGDLRVSSHLTASGNISGSLNRTVSAGSGSFHVLKGDESQPTGLLVEGTITALGDISSSRDITARNITSSANLITSGNISASTLRLTSPGDASVSSTNHAFQSGLTNGANVIINSNEVMARNNGSTADLHLNPDGGAVSFNNSVSTKVRIEGGHITASGNISASGKIFGTTYNSRGIQVISYASSFGRIQIGLDSQGPKPVNIRGNVTASGNVWISGSGNNIYLNNNGSITASGVISASGALAGGSLVVGNTIINTTNLASLNSQAVATTSNVQFANLTATGDTTLGNATTDTHTFKGHITASDNISASNIISNNITASNNISASGDIIATGTGSFGRLEATSGTALQLQNNQKIQFENAAGTEFGNIFMNTSDQMIFQNARSNKNIFIRAGNAGNEGNVIIQKGGTETVIAKFGVAEGQYLSGSLTASGNISASGILTVQKNQFSKTSNTDADHQGDVVFFGSTTSMTAGKIYSYGNNGAWQLADADHNNLSGSGLLGVALGAASDTNGILLRGTVTLDHDPGGVGDVLYLSTTAGQASSTVPSGNGDIVRVIGYCLDASNGQIWFNPDNTFVEVSA